MNYQEPLRILFRLIKILPEYERIAKNGQSQIDLKRRNHQNHFGLCNHLD